MSLIAWPFKVARGLPRLKQTESSRRPARGCKVRAGPLPTHATVSRNLFAEILALRKVLRRQRQLVVVGIQCKRRIRLLFSWGTRRKWSNAVSSSLTGKVFEKTPPARRQYPPPSCGTSRRIPARRDRTPSSPCSSQRIAATAPDVYIETAAAMRWQIGGAMMKRRLNHERTGQPVQRGSRQQSWHLSPPGRRPGAITDLLRQLLKRLLRRSQYPGADTMRPACQ